MNEEELKEKLRKLEEYEARERRKEAWSPYVELESQLRHMYDCRQRLENAAIYQDEASEIANDFGLHLTTHGTADIWDVYADLESEIEDKEKESEALYTRLTLEEEE